jgi:hypothetical protein
MTRAERRELTDFERGFLLGAAVRDSWTELASKQFTYDDTMIDSIIRSTKPWALFARIRPWISEWPSIKLDHAQMLEGVEWPEDMRYEPRAT